MAGGAQGNFMQEGQTGPMTNLRPGFGGNIKPGFGGSASWGGNYGSQINDPQPTGQITGGGYNPGVGVGYQNYLPSMGDGNPWNWNVPYTGPALGVGYTGNPPVPYPDINIPPSIENPGNPGLPYSQNPGMSVMPNGPENIRNPFANVSSGRLAEAQRLAGLGKMGMARQQIERGGGTWNTNIHKALKSGLTGS